MQAAHADPVLDKARELLKAGRSDAASSIYQEVLRQNPAALPPQLALAEIAMRRYQYAQARSILERALTQHPDSAETAASLGRLFQLWGNAPNGLVADNGHDYTALAQEHFTQAKALNGNSPLVLTYTADWALQQNDLVTAERNFNKALETNPTYVPAYQGLTRFYLKTRDLGRAKETAMHAIELDPADQMSYFLVAQLLATANRPAEAVKYAEKSESLDYGRLPARDYFLASQYEKLGQLPKAVQYYENLTVFTPREANIWMKLGEIYEAVGRPEQSMSAFKQAISLNPALLDQLLTQARDNTRGEKTELALSQWRRLLALKADDPKLIREAADAIAGLHYLSWFYHSDQPDASAGRDIQLFRGMLEGQPDDQALRLDLAKLRIAAQGGCTETLRQEIQPLTGSSDAAIAGEAYFLLGNIAKAKEKWEDVDGLSPDENIALADRLLLDQELVFSQTLYQRAYTEAPTPSLQAAIKRIAAKQALAKQRVEEGNILFNSKDYSGAAGKYEEASRIYREWDNVYLRLGNTYEQLKKWPEAKAAYDTAIALSPSLMDSQGFAKNYNKLKKRVASK